MKFLSAVFMLAGYTLVYAAIARGGAFYSNPWEGLFRDAYGADSNPNESTGAGNPASSQPSSNKPAPRNRTPQTP